VVAASESPSRLLWRGRFFERVLPAASDLLLPPLLGPATGEPAVSSKRLMGVETSSMSAPLRMLAMQSPLPAASTAKQRLAFLQQGRRVAKYSIMPQLFVGLLSSLDSTRLERAIHFYSVVQYSNSVESGPGVKQRVHLSSEAVWEEASESP